MNELTVTLQAWFAASVVLTAVGCTALFMHRRRVKQRARAADRKHAEMLNRMWNEGK